MSDTTAQIKAKGCEGTGITPELAHKLYNSLGSHHLAIVELKVDSRTVDADGHQKVQLAISTIEPVIDGKLNGRLDEHVRTIQAALYRNRKLAEDGEQLPLEGGGDEPTVEGVLSAGQALVETDEQGTPVLWDGSLDDDADDRLVEGPDDEGEGDQQDEELVHSYKRAPAGTDTACGLTHNGGWLQTHTDDDQVTCTECKAALDATWDDEDQNTDEDTGEDDGQGESEDQGGRVVLFSGKQG